MSLKHLRRWRLLAAATVLIIWSGAAINGFGLYDVTLAVIFPILMWVTFWRPDSQLVKNARRRDPGR